MMFPKKIFPAGLFLVVFLIGSASAQSWYVTDIIRLAVRSGPGANFDIVGVAQSGQALEILESGDTWSQIRLDNGIEGWVLARYLSENITSGRKLEVLRKKYEDLTLRADTLAKENDRMNKELTQVRAELDQKSREAAEKVKQYETLKKESSQYLTLKSKYEAANATLTQQTQKLTILEEEVGRLESQRTIRWFISGAGVLVVGFIIGFGSKRQRRRPTFLA